MDEAGESTTLGVAGGLVWSATPFEGAGSEEPGEREPKVPTPLPHDIWLMPTTFEVWLHATRANGIPLELEPEDLGLSESLCARIRSWGETFMDQEPMWEWEDVEERISFRLESFRLAALVQGELGSAHEVYVVDRLMPRNKLFKP